MLVNPDSSWLCGIIDNELEEILEEAEELVCWKAENITKAIRLCCDIVWICVCEDIVGNHDWIVFEFIQVIDRVEVELVRDCAAVLFYFKIESIHKIFVVVVHLPAIERACNSSHPIRFLKPF